MVLGLGLKPVLWELRIHIISPGPHPATPLPDTEPMSSERHHEDKAASNPHKVDTVHRLRRCISTHPRQRHSSRGCAALTSSWASKPVSAWVRTQHSTGLRPGPYGYSLRNNIGNNNRIPGVSGNTGIDWPWQRQGMDARLLPHSPSWSNVSHAVFADAPCSPCVCGRREPTVQPQIVLGGSGVLIDEHGRCRATTSKGMCDGIILHANSCSRQVEGSSKSSSATYNYGLSTCHRSLPTMS